MEKGARGTREAAGLRTKLQQSLQSAAAYQGLVMKLEAEVESLQQQVQGAKVLIVPSACTTCDCRHANYQSEPGAAHRMLV